MYYVYVLKSRKDGRFYVGCTADLRKRIAEHNDGKTRSTRHRIPFDLLYYEGSRNHTNALHREKYLKTTYGKRYLKNRLKHELLTSYFTGQKDLNAAEIESSFSSFMSRRRRAVK
ncbi:MAG TPA: GIY-YIG nuclease family protein [Candidatus Binatia bacterium]|nr:GIY-YIG nuclease family protein [Candidatus Binatia bacterium]